MTLIRSGKIGFFINKKMSVNMQKFLNTLWEFTGVKEDKGNFIQKALSF